MKPLFTNIEVEGSLFAAIPEFWKIIPEEIVGEATQSLFFFFGFCVAPCENVCFLSRCAQKKQLQGGGYSPYGNFQVPTPPWLPGVPPDTFQDESWLFNRDPYVMVYEIIPT